MFFPKKNIFLYGPPASGKTTLAKTLGKALGIPSYDLDDRIEDFLGMSIAEFFRTHSEEDFRIQESAVLRQTLQTLLGNSAIIALGGGTLLNDDIQKLCEENGVIFCLDAPDEKELSRRLAKDGDTRPLGDQSKTRAAHYATFPNRIVQSFQLEGSLVLVGNGIASTFLNGKCGIFDETVAKLYPHFAENILTTIPSGELHKTPETIMRLWHDFSEAQVTREDTIISCGGGVCGDLTGFTAATWMRGIPWINIPTTLLAMVDASVGGKTGCDLPEGKNLVGAFHSPRLVIIDQDFLNTLPQRELSAGKAEMIKHAIIGKTPIPSEGIPTAREIAENLAVKVRIVQEDPLETTGKRALLNCGHTIAHALEKATNYKLSHGEAVAIGCVQEAKLAVKQGIAQTSWPKQLAQCFQKVGLPTEIPEGISIADLIPIMSHDKKNCGNNSITFALPCNWERVEVVNIQNISYGENIPFGEKSRVGRFPGISIPGLTGKAGTSPTGKSIPFGELGDSE